jgi:hypothetical protein
MESLEDMSSFHCCCLPGWRPVEKRMVSCSSRVLLLRYRSDVLLDVRNACSAFCSDLPGYSLCRARLSGVSEATLCRRPCWPIKLSSKLTALFVLLVTSPRCCSITGIFLFVPVSASFASIQPALKNDMTTNISLLSLTNFSIYMAIQFMI